MFGARVEGGLLFFLILSVIFHLLVMVISYFRDNLNQDDFLSDPIRCRLFLPDSAPDQNIITAAEPPAVSEIPPPPEADVPEKIDLPPLPDVSWGENTALNEMLAMIAPTPPPADTLEEYTARIWEQIYKQREYPREAAILGWEGEVIVSFTLTRKGSLDFLIVPPGGGSNIAIFDQEALRAVRAASREFPSFPPGIKDRTLSFDLAIKFTADER